MISPNGVILPDIIHWTIRDNNLTMTADLELNHGIYEFNRLLVSPSSGPLNGTTIRKLRLTRLLEDYEFMTRYGKRWWPILQLHWEAKN